MGDHSAGSAGISILTSLTHKETLVVICGLMAAMFLATLDQTIVAVALPRMASDLTGPLSISWVVTSYLVASTAITPVYGKLSDIFGRKRMLQLAISVFLLASVWCASASTTLSLILGRTLQGIGGGGLMAMSHATIADIISPRERGRYQAYFSGVFAAASMLGPLAGGLFVDFLSWRWVFWVNLPIGLAALIVIEAALKGLHRSGARCSIDWPGALLVVVATCIFLSITTLGGHDIPWDSPWITGLGVAGVGMTGLLALWERVADEPILPPRLFTNPVVRSANGTYMVVALAMMGLIVYLPLFFQRVYGMSGRDSGLMLMPFTAATFVGSMAAGQVIARTGQYKLLPPIGLSVSGLSMLAVGLTGAAIPPVAMGVALGLAGFGIGLTFPVVVVAVQNAVDPADLGAGTASVSFFRNLGASFGVALFGAVLQARFGARLGSESDAAQLLQQGGEGTAAAALQLAFDDLFVVSAGFFFLAVATALTLKQLPLKGAPRG